MSSQFLAVASWFFYNIMLKTARVAAVLDMEDVSISVMKNVAIASGPFKGMLPELSSDEGFCAGAVNQVIQRLFPSPRLLGYGDQAGRVSPLRGVSAKVQQTEVLHSVVAKRGGDASSP